MNLDHLKVFYVAASKKNFSETAKSLNLSQPSVSLYIQHLEENLNTKLFDRTTRTIKLTDGGKVLFRYAERIFQLIDNAENELILLTHSIHGDLHIGASTTIGERILPYVLGEFKLKYPQVNLLMKIANSQQILKQMKEGETHIGFVEASYSDPSLHNQPFLEDELVVISSSNNPHPLLQKDDILTPTDLFSLPLILREPGSGTRQVIKESLESIGLDSSQLHVVLELGNTEAVKAAVETGMGISILSKSAIRKELELGTLREIKLKGMNLRRFFYVVYEKNKVLSTAAETFIDFLLNIYKQNVADAKKRP
jgi:LysR family transcriptional regulator, transcriptional activator of the cysJI operon